MGSITIRNLDDETKARLRLQAARHQRSMEEEARNLLREALLRPEQAPRSLADLARERFAPLGGLVLELPLRQPMREPPEPEP
ncbi:MAG: hypothetical protein OEZ06_24875 [Myxococcales bacterium]|nr:hypothetical protein [Myxococcales bacterium]